MRFLVVHLLLGTLAAILGLTSPVPDPTDHRQLFSPVNFNGDVGKLRRDTSTPITDRVSKNDTVENKPELHVWKCDQAGKVCGYWQQSGEVEAKHLIAGRDGAAPVKVLPEDDKSAAIATLETLVRGNGLSSSGSSNAISVRQLFDPAYEGCCQPCGEAIISKYGQRDLDSMSLAERAALYLELRDCLIYPGGSINNVGAREVHGRASAQEEGKRCSALMIDMAYLKIHWDYLNEPNKYIWWLVLTACLKMEPTPPFRVRQLHERENDTLDSTMEWECTKDVVRGWTGDLSNDKGEAALMLALMKCTNQTETISGPRVSNGSDPYIVNVCLDRVTQRRGSDLSTKEDQDAFVLAVRRCISKAQTPATNIASMLDKREECNIPRFDYYFWAYKRLTLYVLGKFLDESRWNSALIRDGMLPCTSGAVDYYHEKCVPNADPGILDARINHCWFTMFKYGGPGCSQENPCKRCGQDRPPHICP